MSDDIKKNISDVNIWKRALFMLLFAILYGLAEIVVWAVVLFQFLIILFTGSKNERLLDLGQNLTTYIYQIVMFQTFNTERQPFPFGDWPDGPPDEYDDDDDDDDDEDDDDDDDEDDSDDANQKPEVETVQLESDAADLEEEADAADGEDEASPEGDSGKEAEEENKPAN